MGSVWSAEDYHSDWERAYVTREHNGSTVCMYGMPIDNGSYDDLLKNDSVMHDLRLLFVHGVFNLENLRLEFERPLKNPGKFVLKKFGCHPSFGEQSAEIAIPAGAETFSLDGYRAGFVAYRDCLTHLRVGLTADSPARLRSDLGETPKREQEVRKITMENGEVTSSIVKIPIPE